MSFVFISSIFTLDSSFISLANEIPDVLPPIPLVTILSVPFPISFWIVVLLPPGPLIVSLVLLISPVLVSLVTELVVLSPPAIMSGLPPEILSLSFWNCFNLSVLPETP